MNISNIYSLTRNINKFYIRSAKFFRRPYLLGYPRELFIEPTNICNAKCPLCPTGAGLLTRKKGYMSFDLYKQIINEVKPFTETIYLWNLGEPFLHPDIFEMIAFAKKFHLFVMSSTNGYGISTKDYIEKIIESNLDRLIVGVDGTDEATFSKYRKGIHFNAVMNGLEYLAILKKKKKIKLPIVDFQFIVMKHNQHQYEEARRLSKKYGANFRPKFVNLEMVDKGNSESWLPDDSSWRTYQYANGEYKLKREQKGNCCVSWDGLVINWDGGVNPCIFDYYNRVQLGNVREQEVKSIWRGKSLTNFRKNIVNEQYHKICRKCPIEKDYTTEFIYDRKK